MFSWQRNTFQGFYVSVYVLLDFYKQQTYNFQTRPIDQSRVSLFSLYTIHTRCVYTINLSVLKKILISSLDDTKQEKQ